MPLFEYRGLTRDGKNTKGTLDAENVRAARMKLKKDGIYVSDIRDRQKANNAANKQKRSRGKKVPIRDLALMTRQLATLIKPTFLWLTRSVLWLNKWKIRRYQKPLLTVKIWSTKARLFIKPSVNIQIFLTTFLSPCVKPAKCRALWI